MLNAIVNKRSKPASRVIDRRLNDRVYVHMWSKPRRSQIKSNRAAKPRSQEHNYELINKIELHAEGRT